MFFGTTPQIISQFLETEIRRINPKRIIVPFSGNFVVEQIAGLVDKNIPVICTDISLYSRAIGYTINDVESEIELKKEYTKDFPSFKGKLSPMEKAACVIFFAEVSKTISKKDKVAYYRNLYKDAMINQEMYKAQILGKLTSFKEILGDVDYLGTDGVEVARNVKKGDLVFYDPPVDLGSYEKEFKHLEDCFEFVIPPYTDMSDEVKMKDLKIIDEKKAVCYYRNNNPIEGLPKSFKEVFRFQYKYNASYCVYTNSPNATWVGRFNPLKEEVKNLKIMMEDHKITEDSKIELIKVKSSVSNHYRLMWVKKAEMKDAGTPYMVMIDGLVTGVIQLMAGTTFGHDLAVINSDPATPTSSYNRLSKLILYICCTRQMLNRFNEEQMWEHNGFTTRVFTNNPISMKYRGMFKLIERKDDDGFFKFNLVYQNRDKILDTYQDGLKAWLKKDALK